jgi:RNA polymerase sigma-54 factor
MALRQQQHLKQQQRLSPQQIQIIKMLELPTLEFEERIKNELDENPALEEGAEYQEEHDDLYDEKSDSQGDSDFDEDISLGDYMNEDDIPAYKLAEINSREERRESFFHDEEQSLSDYLLYQLQLNDMSDRERQIGEFIIGNIDDDGYLRRDLTAVSNDLAFLAGEEISTKEIEKTLKTIQDFDPPGVGARNLQECLTLQLNKRDLTRVTIAALNIMTNFFEDFTRKHYEKIQKVLNIDASFMKAVIQEITSLNPKPGSNWDNSMTTVMNHITPDFIVETGNGEVSMSLNNRGVPDLRVNREYVDMLRDYSSNKVNQTSEMRDAVIFVKQKIEAAQGFIDAVRQRQETLQRTMQAIIRLQGDFFLTGDESKLHPMILKDVAAKTGYDISTISRISKSKYVQTNFGVYPLKFFFSESAQTENGETVSTHKIKKLINEIVDNEDKKNPITDDELTAALNAKGFIIARRTVAKYREQLGIPVSRMRRDAF